MKKIEKVERRRGMGAWENVSVKIRERGDTAFRLNIRKKVEEVDSDERSTKERRHGECGGGDKEEVVWP